MITPGEAENIIQSTCRSFGTESISLDDAGERILAEEIITDTELPSFNRVTMDGIAIFYKSFKEGTRHFRILATQAAGKDPIDINEPGECIEIMTGAALPSSTDTVIRYEDLEIKNGVASVITENIIPGQNIHFKGIDKKKDDVLIRAGQSISPQVISIAAAMGKQKLLVKTNPRIVIISTGDELAKHGTQPSPFQIRGSNDWLLKAALKYEAVDSEIKHFVDQREVLENELKTCINLFDVLIITGGISMGKYDLVPEVLEHLGITLQFRKVSQKPAKPFCFGVHENGTVVFAFPGNPVSACLCYYRYFLPWLRKSMGLSDQGAMYAVLSGSISSPPNLTYYPQVTLRMNEKGELIATPIKTNGSGDYTTLAETDAFMELPPERNNFVEGEVFRVWILSK